MVLVQAAPGAGSGTTAGVRFLPSPPLLLSISLSPSFQPRARQPSDSTRTGAERRACCACCAQVAQAAEDDLWLAQETWYQAQLRSCLGPVQQECAAGAGPSAAAAAAAAAAGAGAGGGVAPTELEATAAALAVAQARRDALCHQAQLAAATRDEVRAAYWQWQLQVRAVASNAGAGQGRSG